MTRQNPRLLGFFHGSRIAQDYRRESSSDWARLSAIAVLALLCGLGATASRAADRTRYFSIRINQKLIGYASFSSQSEALNGRPAIRWDSSTSLKVALLGKVRNTTLASKTWLDAETGELLQYRMTDTTNGAKRHYDVDIAKGKARSWIYAEGEPKGEGKQIELPKDAVILGGNNFAHWHLMLKAAQQRAKNGKAEISVFLPENGQVTKFPLQAGKPQDIELSSGPKSCIRWSYEKAKLHALVDAKSHEFVGLMLPAQDTKIELAEESVVKMAQKAQAEELLARHFAQSNVTFADFMAVRSLKAKIDVRLIGSGIENKVDILTTSMQKFTGTKEVDHVVGLVEVKSSSYDGKDSPVFPGSETEPSLQPWLKPSLYIESDDEAIASMAKELTKNAKNRWEAVKGVGGWVCKEIAYTIADSPSAEMALEKKEGDCGPHSTLTVAMLRSVGIPARLVGGLVYTPSFGGSFGQHAWVEVHMGAKGWVAVDPTTGEFDILSATHIKLFEGIGGVLPASIKVEAYEPQNRKTAKSLPTEPKPLNWTIGKKYAFRYQQGEKELGKEEFVIREVKEDGKSMLEMTSDIKLRINFLISLVSKTQMRTSANASPISFQRDLAVALQKVKTECKFKKGGVEAKTSGTTNLEREVKLPQQIYCFDNNLLGSFVLICSQVPVETKEPLTVQTFHPSSLQIIPLTFTPKGPAKVKIGEKEIDSFEFDVSPIKNSFFISADNRLLRVVAGGTSIELTEVD